MPAKTPSGDRTASGTHRREDLDTFTEHPPEETADASVSDAPELTPISSGNFLSTSWRAFELTSATSTPITIGIT
jgi:hypothetical protein